MPTTNVSVIIPYIDELAFLAEAVASVAAQTPPVGEIIIVCNAPAPPSQPPTFPVSPLSVLWMHEPVSGSAHARNAGLRNARGEWVQFLDVDDLLLPGKIAHQVGAPGIDVVVSPHRFRYVRGREADSAWHPEDVWTGLLGSGLGSTSSMLFRRDALLQSGGWSPDWQSHQEYELLFRLLQQGSRIACVDERQTIVRQRRAGSITLTSQSFRAAAGIRLRLAMRDYLAGRDMLTPGREEAFRQYVFRQLRGLYRTDRSKALALHREWFAGTGIRLPAGLPPGYPLLYRLGGFDRTERLLGRYRMIRDKYFPFLPRHG